MSQSHEPADGEVVAEARAEASAPGRGPSVDDAVEADQDAARAATVPEPDAAPASERKGSLWRDGNFLTMWGGQTFSQFGAQITELAIPVLAVLVLNATEFEVGLLNAANVAAFLVVGLPAGAWIDRMRKRHVMIWADAVRAVALATVPLLWLTGTLQIWHLIVVALIMGVATVFFDVSYQSIVPSLVRPHQIAEANGKLQSSYELANIAGPGIGGWLIGILTAPLAIFVTVFTYLASLVALLFTRDREVRRAPEDHQPILKEIGEGLRWVFGNPLLRRIVATTGFANLFSTMTFTLLPIYLLRVLELTPAQMGVIFSLGAVGGLIGAIATPRIVKRFGEARTIPISAIGFSLAPVLLPVATLVPQIAFPFLVVQFFLVQLHGAGLQRHAGHLPPAHHSPAPARQDERVDPVLRLGRDADRRAHRRSARHLDRRRAHPVDRRRARAAGGSVRHRRPVLVDARPARCRACRSLTGRRSSGIRHIRREDTDRLIWQPLARGAVRGLS